MRSWFVRPIYFVWVLAPAVLLAIYLMFGLPHILWSYEWTGVRNASFEERWKTRCHFIGPYGGFTIRPQNGSCGWWIRFFKQEGAR